MTADFQFRHFSVSQKNSALKVGTDAMVLGAVCSFPEHGNLLDIGTGTGVLALIAAQRFSPQKVVALEPDSKACRDAEKNFSASAFSCKPQLIQTRVQDFFPDYCFDGIISNPPYFIDSTKSGSVEKDNARHQTELSLEDLLSAVNRFLSDKGIFWLILPFDQQQLCTELAREHGLFPHSVTEVQGKPGKPVRNIISLGKTEKVPVAKARIVIRTDLGAYTGEYIELTKELHGKQLT